MRPHRWQVVLLSAISLTSALLEALFIVLLTGIAMALVGRNSAVGPAFGQTFSMPTALTTAAGMLLVRVVLSLWSVHVSAALTASVTSAQRQRLAQAYLRASWAAQHAEPAGRLQELLTTFVTRITNSVSTLAAAIAAGLSLVAFLGTGIVMDAVATGVVLVALALVAGILTPLRRAIGRRSRGNAQAGISFANAVSELGSLGLEMQAFGAERQFESRIEDLTGQTTVTQQRTQELQGAMPHVYMSLAYAALLAGVALLATIGFTDLTAVGAVMLLMLRSLAYGQQLATASASLAANLPFLEQVDAAVERYTSQPAGSGTKRPAQVVPIEARVASFAYTPGRVALAGANFRLEPGEAIGVIGPSGAGKSTLAQLLLGLRAPTSGAITTSGVPLVEVDRTWWTERVAFVAQDANLFTGTVAENIRFFRGGIEDEDLRRAAQQANILADIDALPHGFDTHLGERGSHLSGGQRQRLSIARALAGRPELLILDEPTSALDGQSEALIRESLMSLHGALSVVIIAHRMSTLEICDRIMVIEGGTITAIGPPTLLRSNNAFYRTALGYAGIP